MHAIKIWWERLSSLPGGKWVFSRLVGVLIPYTGSIRPLVLEVNWGFAKVAITDRRALRNHLRSLHAIALANLGEFTTGLALHRSMPTTSRAILTQLRTDYLKKARGKIIATATIEQPLISNDGIMVVEAHLFDNAKNLVAKVTAHWLVKNDRVANTAKS